MNGQMDKPAMVKQQMDLTCGNLAASLLELGHCKMSFCFQQAGSSSG